MDFRFGPEQLALQATVAEFCSDRLPLTAVAGREGRAAAPDVWQGLADLGVLGMLADQGEGIGAVEAAIVFEVLGAYLAPGPMSWSCLAAALVPDVGTGRRRVTGVSDVRDSAGVVVPHARESSDVIVLHDDRVALHSVADLVELVDGSPLDPLTPVAVCTALPAGREVGDRVAAQRLRLLGTVLSAAGLVGVAQGALDVARSYALDRKQFGQPIGSFQAVKHILADMFVRVELARSATYAAAATIAEPRIGDAVRAVSGAKVLAGEAGLANGRAAVQVLGGMGFTWDMLPHYFLKRAWVLEQAFGAGSSHALLLAGLLDQDLAG